MSEAPNVVPARPGVAAWSLTRPGRGELALMAVAVVGISLSAPLTALLTAPVLGLAFWRNAIGAAVLAPGGATVARRELAGLTRRQLGLSMLAGLFLAGHFVTWLPSITLTSVAASTALVTTTPIWTTLAARMAGHAVPRRVWVGLACSLVGVVLVTGVDVTVSAEALLGDLLALVGGALAAGYVLLGSAVRTQVSTTSYALVCYSTCAAVVAVAALATGTPLVGYSTHDWSLIVAIAVCAQLLGHTVFNRVVSTVGPTVVGLAILLEVPGAGILAFVLLGQVPPLLGLPGLALIVGGIALVIRAGGTPADPVPPT